MNLHSSTIVGQINDDFLSGDNLLYAMSLRRSFALDTRMIVKRGHAMCSLQFKFDVHLDTENIGRNLTIASTASTAILLASPCPDSDVLYLDSSQRQNESDVFLMRPSTSIPSSSPFPSSKSWPSEKARKHLCPTLKLYLHPASLCRSLCDGNLSLHICTPARSQTHWIQWHNQTS